GVQTIRPSQLGPLLEEKPCKFSSHISEAGEDDSMPHFYLIKVREALPRVRSARESRARITAGSPLPRPRLRLQLPEARLTSCQAFHQVPVRVPHPNADESVHSELVARQHQRGLLLHQATPEA